MIDIDAMDLEFYNRIESSKKFWKDHFNSFPNAASLEQSKINMLNGLDLAYTIWHCLKKEYQND
jgi:hypothetical protein